MLEEIPYLSYYATKYLGLFFNDDPRIAETLLEHASNANNTAEKRVNCIRALITNGYPFESLVAIIRQWFQEEDFQLLHAGVDILAEVYDDVDFWMELTSPDHNVHVRARAFFELAKARFLIEDDFVSIVNRMWEDDSFYIQLMGIYFRRRQLDITSSKFDTDQLMPDLLSLFFTLDEHEENQNFFRSFANVFGFELSTHIGLERKLPSVKQTTQLLINVSDAPTDGVVLFSSLRSLVHNLLVAVTCRLYPDHKDLSYWGVVHKLHAKQQKAVNALSRLHLIYEKARAGYISDIKYAERQKTIVRSKNVIALDIARLYRKLEIPTPFSLDLYVKNWWPQKPKPMSNKVFISYSHNDFTWMARLTQHLTPLQLEKKLDIWVDTRIQPGEQWLPKIKNALTDAKVVVMLVSPAFLASPFIREHEFLPTLKEAKTGGKTILWVLLSDCLWDVTQISDFQAAHEISSPLDTLDVPQQNIVLTSICRKIKQVAFGS